MIRTVKSSTTTTTKEKEKKAETEDKEEYVQNKISKPKSTHGATVDAGLSPQTLLSQFTRGRRMGLEGGKGWDFQVWS